MTDLQDALNTPIFVDIALPIEERRHQSKAVATLKEAARRVANPDYEAALVKLVSIGDDFWIDEAQEIVDAALGITEDE